MRVSYFMIIYIWVRKTYIQSFVISNWFTQIVMYEKLWATQFKYNSHPGTCNKLNTSLSIW